MTLDPSSPFGYEKVLMEWAKVNLKNTLWKNALSAARNVSTTPAKVGRKANSCTVQSFKMHDVSNPV